MNTVLVPVQVVGIGSKESTPVALPFASVALPALPLETSDVKTVDRRTARTFVVVAFVDHLVVARVA